MGEDLSKLVRYQFQTLRNFHVCALQVNLVKFFFIWLFRFKDALFDPEELKNLEDIRNDIHAYREYVYPVIP
jgi:hypothetical protein